MQARRRGPARPAFTLIEMLVVISIIVILASVTVVYILPSFQERKNVQRGADKVSAALLIAKQRAFRDQLPRGVRLLTQPNVAGFPVCRELQYVEVPEPFSEGSQPGQQALVALDPADPTGMTLVFNLPNGRLTTVGVIVNDFITVPGYGSRSIAVIPPATNKVLLSSPFSPSLTTGQSYPYKIYRQPRPLAGEDTVKLPDGVVVLMNLANSFSAGSRGSNIAANPFLDVMFSSSGGVMPATATTTQSNTVMIWVADESTLADTPTPSTVQIIAVQKGTGFIAAHPIDVTSGDYYRFARDGRASGM